MMAAYRQREKRGAEDLRTQRTIRIPAASAAEPSAAPKPDRDDDETGIPHDVAHDLESGHADVMHRGNAAAYKGATKPRTAARRGLDRQQQAGAGDDDRCDQRRGRQRDIVAARNAGRERQHGDEMRRPDAQAGGDRRHATQATRAAPRDFTT